MANILLNALSSTAGGGLTYLYNVLPRLSRREKFNKFTVLLPADFEMKTDTEIEMVRLPEASLLARFKWEQITLRNELKRRNIDLLISLGNFALLRSPMPQILFSRNELYYSDYFRRDLWQRRAWRMLAEHELKAWLAGRSLGAASHHVVPTAAMSAHLRKAGVLSDAIAVLPFGFDPEIFTQSKEPLAAEQLAKLQSTPTASKILYVSHYNYFRNFETLLRALPLIKEKIGRPVQLVLTTELRRDGNYGGYDATRDVELIERLKLTDDLVMLGAVAYRQLHEVYRACDLFACPSYAESFGHPLLEAMANDLPVIAANLPVHREICQNAATYFDVFDETELAIRVAEVLKDEPLRKRLVEAGRQRVKEFSWDAHVEGLMQLMDEVLSAA